MTEQLSASATFVEECNFKKIRLTIENEIVELEEGDLIEFKRKGLPEGKLQRAKILAFGWHNSSQYANRIFFLPWREEENRWGSHVIPMRGMPLEHGYFHRGGPMDLSLQQLSQSDPSLQQLQQLSQSDPNGDWKTIKKLDKSSIKEI